MPAYINPVFAHICMHVSIVILVLEQISFIEQLLEQLIEKIDAYVEHSVDVKLVSTKTSFQHALFDPKHPTFE